MSKIQSTVQEIRQRLRSSHISDRAIGSRLGIAPGTVKNFREGTHQPNLVTIEIFERVLDDDFFKPEASTIREAS